MSSLPHPGRFVTAIIILASLTVQPVLAQSNMYGPETSPDSTRQVRPNPYTGQALRDTLAVLPDTARIDFVNDHFYQIYSADFELAVDVSAEALGLSQSLGDVRREGFSAMHHGLGLAMSGRLDETLSHYLHALEIFETLNDVEGLKLLKFEMAAFYRRQGNLERALELLDYVEQASRDTDDNMNLARVLGYRGTMLAQAGDFEEARPFYEEVYRLRVELGDSIGLGYALLDMASLALSQENYPEAYRFVDESIEVRRAIGDMQGLAISTLARGETLFAEGRLSEVPPYYDRALRMARSLGFDDLARYIFDRYIDLHETMGNHELALGYLRQRTALSDSLFNVERVKVIEELNTRYETERRDRQIAELEREREVRELTLQRNRVMTSGLGATLLLLMAVGFLWQSKVRQRELEYRVNALELEQRMQRERERISRDLHDHVGAQLVNIISGLSLAERFSSGKLPSRSDMNEADLLASLRTEAQHTIKQLRDTIWTLSNNEISPEAFQEYLGNYLQQFRALTGIKVDVHFDERLADALSPARALNIFRIIQEALQNAAKHSGGDSVLISFENEAGRLVGKIRDNGSFRKPQDRIDGGGSGLGNMKKRAEEAGGTLQVHGDASGTVVEFVFDEAGKSL